MNVKFRGFGLNLSTMIVLLLASTLLAGVLTLVKPVVIPGSSAGGDTISAATYPCQPYAWRSKNIENRHSGSFWYVTVAAKIQYNGCDVMVVPSSQQCSHWAIGFSVNYAWCSSYRLYTYTAYGQQLVVGARVQVFVLWSGFPVTAAVHICQLYNRNGNLLSQWNGPYGAGC